ncbi:glycosyltransferase involved in cell wall biosynthesis [Vibrio crassostreae]|uniref:glycosyltransferase family 2 protein n=3 Tax=Vibrio crassostreae TaxID=246167 RepID=UPI000F477B67|nr:glycosyltransferase family 2 protein [Vibrio crassostreae]ROO66102.1 glycosyltransferase involved in cell wall biosynthesis [Vibrio crassostreae]ROQ72023.1 glycosyltransferase involved in cell wall biosynthesis [Vibrio crassostreae]ROR77632.1 glycosyltransferase involved in cell wall biosynthesis [Vibrio crassostreae]RPE88049.1 glycosyltransferase involved in cell wall biosynthesis [Vibrio crassostreae]RPF12410.1 glycosyltransferase involved in cell wall biosynthesis [Vibrio crassostreae]
MCNKKSAFISIVIPFYNSGKTITQTIQSLLANKLDTCELVFVNDGSEDKTVDIIVSKLSESGVKYKIIHQNNSGVSVARNNGVINSNGDFILFLDSDDVLLRGAIESIENLIRQNYRDVSLFEYFKFSKIEYLNNIDSRNFLKELSEKKKFIKDYLYGNLIKKISVCSCVYSREFLIENKIEFNSKYAFAEDQLFLIDCLVAGSALYYANLPVLGYFFNPDSVTSQFNYRRFEAIEIFEGISKENTALKNAMNYRINMELIGICRIFTRDSSLSDSIGFYKNNIKPIWKDVKKEGRITLSLDYKLFSKFKKFYVLFYKAYSVMKNGKKN